ncbi:MAG: carboxypeptidase-like regulatory domain-containing protein [Vicinamibacterales bacterium]
MQPPLQRWAVALVFGLSSVLPAAAQLATGTLAGRIQDSQGAVVPGAQVVLTSATQATRAEFISDQSGNFVFAGLSPGSYVLDVSISGFKRVHQTGVTVSAGDRAVVPSITLELGRVEEIVEVRASAPLIQARSGERSFTIPTESVTNLPLINRNYATLASLAPGVDGTARIGGGGATTFTLDGVSTMDTGSNRLLVAVNVESIAEVKVLSSGYQAEFGRSSGLQIAAVTKGGSNQFRGTLYDVLRNSDWNANSRTNILNGDPKPVSKQMDWGYSIGGPVGKPGGRNTLFFFYAHEYQPRTAGNDVVRYRLPTALERAGDFSQSTDNNGALYNLIRDASTGLPCTASDTRGCFQDGGVLGRIPANRLYTPSLNLLKLYPLPNVSGTGLPYNYEITRPVEKLLSHQPAIRVDYQPVPALRGTFKYTGWLQRNQVINGEIPVWGDSQMQRPIISMLSMSAAYSVSDTWLIEGTFGRSANEQAGCALNGGGPNFCTEAIPTNPDLTRPSAGLTDLPLLFPNANVVNPSYYAYGVFNDMKPPIWDGSRIQLPPAAVFGGRVSSSDYAPPDLPFPGFLNVNRTWDLLASVTKVAGSHTLKAGFYNTHSFKAQNRENWQGTLTFSNDNNNPIDSTFGFANAALGIFSQYRQASGFVEGAYVYTNTEGYLQDNWKVHRNLTLDVGLRLVHQQPQHDSLGQGSNFLPDRWNRGAAPVLFVAGCAGGSPCTGNNRQAMNPVTSQLLGSGSAAAIGTLVPRTGNTTNGLFLSGQGISQTTYTWPTLAFAPRVGAAYDVGGRQRLVARGAFGIFYDRPDGNAIFPQVQNPPTYTIVTVRNAQLQSLAAGLAIEGAPALSVYEYDSKLPSSAQWNTGVQMMLPHETAVDVAYVGQRSYNTLQSVNLNAVDLGSAYTATNQDPTLAASATPGATAVTTDLMRPYRGYGAITQQWGRGWRTFHSLQLALQRRFRNGLSFSFNDTIALSDKQSAVARLDHRADGSYVVRDDQAQADALLGDFVTNRHVMKASWVWAVPNLTAARGNRVLSAIVNGWQVSGIWTGITGAPYTVSYSYQSGGSAAQTAVNLTGSPDYQARIRIVGDPGSGCSDDPLRQFNTSAFQGPLPGSVGLESSASAVRGCFLSTFDLSVARTIGIGGTRNLQFRVDVFNALNSATVTGRNSTLSLASIANPVTPQNLPFDAAGNVIASRSVPRTAGFGVANAYQAPRSVQLQLRLGW